MTLQSRFTGRITSIYLAIVDCMMWDGRDGAIPTTVDSVGFCVTNVILLHDTYIRQGELC